MPYKAQFCLLKIHALVLQAAVSFVYFTATVVILAYGINFELFRVNAQFSIDFEPASELFLLGVEK